MYRYNNKLITYNNKPIRALVQLPFPTNGLVSYWKMDETSGTIAYDSYGVNNGTASNARVFGTSGKINNCADFTKGNDYINFGNSSDFNIANNAKTISFWIYGRANISNSPAFIAKSNGGSSTTSYGWMILGLSWWSGIGVVMASSTSAHFGGGINNNIVPENQWNHYCFTMSTNRTSNANFLKGYLNGVEITLGYSGSITNHTNPIQNTVPLVIGTESDYQAEHYINVLMDEVGIWNRVLSAEEVTTLYNNGDGLTL